MIFCILNLELPQTSTKNNYKPDAGFAFFTYYILNIQDKTHNVTRVSSVKFIRKIIIIYISFNNYGD